MCLFYVKVLLSHTNTHIHTHAYIYVFKTRSLTNSAYPHFKEFVLILYYSNYKLYFSFVLEYWKEDDLPRVHYKSPRSK